MAKNSTLHETAVETSAGVFVLKFSSRGLAAIAFPSRARSAAVHPPKQLDMWVRLTRDAIEAVLDGKSPRALPPLDLSSGTGFQRRVWNALLKIPPGSTQSYARIAGSIGAPRASRAVGGACGANPIPLLVPCHRVVASHGGLGGFSGGLDWKKRLLVREGALPAASAN